MKAPFSIEAINNEFEVLAVFLGIADDNDHERSQIKVLGMQDRIHKFQYNGELFSVARKDMLPGVAAAREFNSNWYAVQKGHQSMETMYEDGQYWTHSTFGPSVKAAWRRVEILGGLVRVIETERSPHEFSQASFFEVNTMVGKADSNIEPDGESLNHPEQGMLANHLGEPQ